MKMNRCLWLKALLIPVCSLTVASRVAAQDEASSTTESRSMNIMVAGDSAGGAPLMFSTMSSSVDGGAPTFTTFSIDPSSAVGMPFGFPGMPAPDPMDLIRDMDIQKEIELDTTQLDNFNRLQKDVQETMNEYTKELQGGRFDREKLKELGTKMKKVNDETKEKIREMLLPHQLDRLNQISVQRHMQYSGTAGALASKQLAEQLGISEEQIERLKKKSEEANKELTEKMEQLKNEAREKVLAELTKEQREKLEALIGKKYTPAPVEPTKTAPTIRRSIRGGGASPESGY